MATFVNVATQAPRVVPGVSSAGLAVSFKPVSLQGESSSDGSFFTSAGLMAVAALSIFGALRRRRSRVTSYNTYIRGPKSGMCWYEYKYKSKPGDKYTSRWLPFDQDVPEWGVWPNQEPDRLIKFGRLLKKGSPKYEPIKPVYDDWFVSTKIGRGEVEGALLLDCDGTLVETERDGHRVAFNKAFKEKGFDFEWDVELYGELLTTGGGKERMARYFTDYNKEAWTAAEPPSASHPLILELHELKTKLFMEIVKSGELPLRAGIKELLTAAVAAGWKLAVCSTSNEASVRAVVETMLPDFADQMSIYAGDIVSDKKPSPAVYQLACKKLGFAPMKCVVIEDSAIGAQAGKAAGMKVIVTKSIYSANEDFGDADLIVGSAAELDFEKDVLSLIPVMNMA